MPTTIEKFTGQIWEESELRNLAVGDLFRIRQCDELPDCGCECGEDEWFVVLSPPFVDENGEWNAVAADYPDSLKIH